MFIVHRNGMINMIPMDMNEKRSAQFRQFVWCKRLVGEEQVARWVVRWVSKFLGNCEERKQTDC